MLHSFSQNGVWSNDFWQGEFFRYIENQLTEAGYHYIKVRVIEYNIGLLTSTGFVRDYAIEFHDEKTGKDMMLIPAFRLTWEQVADRPENINDFAKKVVALGGVMTRNFDTQTFTIHLPDQNFRVADASLELVNEISQQMINETDIRVFSAFCRGVIEAGGIIVPNWKESKFYFYMPTEGA